MYGLIGGLGFRVTCCVDVFVTGAMSDLCESFGRFHFWPALAETKHLACEGFRFSPSSSASVSIARMMHTLLAREQGSPSFTCPILP